MRVRVADDSTHRSYDMGAQHLPVEEVWVIGEPRLTGERKDYLSNLPADMPVKQLAGAIKARWFASKPISNSRRSLASTTSKGCLGKVCVDTSSCA